jgi:hypothetical protein
MGLVGPQKGGSDSQTVVFTFKGEIKEGDHQRWNDAIEELKQKFPHVVATTHNSTLPASTSHGTSPPSKPTR